MEAADGGSRRRLPQPGLLRRVRVICLRRVRIGSGFGRVRVNGTRGTCVGIVVALRRVVVGARSIRIGGVVRRDIGAVRPLVTADRVAGLRYRRAAGYQCDCHKSL